ncbi:MAG TPA: DUF2853 family protein [Flavobacterium sp.]|nr:DUF2853 family protein [Flavobacterium sp.]
MSKFDEAVEKYLAENKNLKLGISEDFLRKVAKGLGPSIYNKDAETIASSDSSELETVKKNFLIKKLGLNDSPELDKAIQEVVEKLGVSNRNKYRALFYALLAIKFKKESVYN